MPQENGFPDHPRAMCGLGSWEKGWSQGGKLWAFVGSFARSTETSLTPRFTPASEGEDVVISGARFPLDSGSTGR